MSAASRKQSGRRRTPAKRKAKQNASQELLEPVAESAQLNIEAEKFLSDPVRIVGDANQFVKLMTLGVVSEEIARKVLQRGFELATSTDSPKEYAAILKAIESCAKLAASPKSGRTPSQHVHFHGVVDDASDARGNRLAEIASKVGLPKLAQRCRVGEFSSG